MAKSEDLQQLNDYDVLGIGAVRRAHLESQTNKVVLQLHSQLVPPAQKEIYQHILQETQAWLKPAEVREEKIVGSVDQFIFLLLVQDLQTQFPNTTRLLGERAAPVVRSYLDEFPWQGPLLTDQFRYFPMFLQQKYQDSRLYLVAQKEWLWSYLSFADFGHLRQEDGLVTVNLSLQTLPSNMEVPEVNLHPGLYICYYDERVQKVREHKMDVLDAAVVDTLQEDRKYTLDQLIEQVLMMDFASETTAVELRKRVLFLIGQGILSESGSKIF